MRRKCLAAFGADRKRELKVTIAKARAEIDISPPERVSSTNQLSIDEDKTEGGRDPTRGDLQGNKDSNFSMRVTKWGENRKNTLCINDLCLWCVRRAVAFVGVSIGYLDHLGNKVHFGASAFEEMPL